MAYYDDDGNEYFPELYPKPDLCLICKWNNHPGEDILCNLTRLGQLNKAKFRCGKFEKHIKGNELWRKN